MFVGFYDFYLIFFVIWFIIKIFVFVKDLGFIVDDCFGESGVELV